MRCLHVRQSKHGMDSMVISLGGIALLKAPYRPTQWQLTFAKYDAGHTCSGTPPQFSVTPVSEM